MTLKSALILTTLALTGCNTLNAPKTPRSDPYSAQQIHVDSEQLRRDTAVGAPTASRDNSGLLVVTIPLRSTIDKTLYVDCYISWYDKAGHPLAQRLGPKSITLDPFTPNSITFTSMSRQAEDFQLDLRYSR